MIYNRCVQVHSLSSASLKSEPARLVIISCIFCLSWQVLMFLTKFEPWYIIADKTWWNHVIRCCRGWTWPRASWSLLRVSTRWEVYIQRIESDFSTTDRWAVHGREPENIKQFCISTYVYLILYLVMSTLAYFTCCCRCSCVGGSWGRSKRC